MTTPHAESADAFEPYANERDVLRIGHLEIENRIDRISLTGDVVLTRDRAGLVLAMIFAGWESLRLKPLAWIGTGLVTLGAAMSEIGLSPISVNLAQKRLADVTAERIFQLWEQVIQQVAAQ